MELDYTKWNIGVALSDKIVLVACPVCTRPCHAKITKVSAKYIHRARVERVLPTKEQIAKREDKALEGSARNGHRFDPNRKPPKIEARNKVVPTHFCAHTKSEREAWEGRERSRIEREKQAAQSNRAGARS